MIEVDAELDRLAADLGRAGRGVARKARRVVEKGANNVKADARRLATGMSHAPLYPRSISYDITVEGEGTIVAEVGPDKSRPQGALGNLLEYGSVNNAPHAHLGPALDREGPGFTAALADVVGEVLG